MTIICTYFLSQRQKGNEEDYKRTGYCFNWFSINVSIEDVRMMLLLFSSKNMFPYLYILAFK